MARIADEGPLRHHLQPEQEVVMPVGRMGELGEGGLEELAVAQAEGQAPLEQAF